MLTKWARSGHEKVFYQLDEATTRQLHSACHQSPSPSSRTHIPPVRLLVLVKQAGSSTFKAHGLSDFIQPIM